jgi:hypothetical protein
MNLTDEKLQILHKVERGQIKADKAAHLLAALEEYERPGALEELVTVLGFVTAEDAIETPRSNGWRKAEAHNANTQAIEK